MVRGANEGLLRMRSTGRQKVASFPTLAILLWFWPGFASATDYVPPPPQFVLDENGVDPKSLVLNYSEVDITAGSGITEVQLVRGIPTHRNTGRQEFGKWINSFTGYAYTSYDNSDDPSPGFKIGDTTVHVVVGNKSFSFVREYMSDWEPGDPATSIVTTGTTPNLTITVTDVDGTVYQFSATSGTCAVHSDGYQNFCGRLSKMTQPNGVTWDVDYDAGRLKRARSNVLFAAIFEYTGSGDQPSKACLVNQSIHYVAGLMSCPAGALAATYSATADALGVPLTSSATKADGRQLLYDHRWNVPDAYFAMRYAGDSIFQLHYRRFFAGGAEYRRGASLSGTGGDLWTYTGTYVDPCRPSCIARQATQMIVTSPDAKTVKYEWRDYVAAGTHFIDPLPKKVTNQLGYFQTIDYGLTGGYVRGVLWPRTVTQPESNQLLYTYDTRGNRLTQTAVPKTGSGLSNIAVSADFPITCTIPATCNKPISATDANGNQSHFAYANHGGVLTEMGPAPVVNGARPLKVTIWTQRYGWLKNSSGSLVQAAAPIWVKASETRCQTVAGSNPVAACDGAAPQTVTTYEYGSAGTGESLLLKGMVVSADGTSLRTCFGYDGNARRISETLPNANLSSCS